MSIQSKFYNDVSKYEPEFVGGFTKRQFKMILWLTPGIIFLILEAVFLPELLLYVFGFFTAIFLIAPPILIYLGKFQSFKKDVEFYIMDQERIYQSEQIRRYDKSEFIQKKHIKETDTIGTIKIWPYDKKCDFSQYN